MRLEAEQFAEEDRQRRRFAVAVNSADNAIYAAEKYLYEAGESAPEELRFDVQNRIQNTRKAMKGDDIEVIKLSTLELLNLIQKLGTEIHEQGTDSLGETTSFEDDPPSDEDTVEGEFYEDWFRKFTICEG